MCFCFANEDFGTVKPSISSHSKPCKTPRTRLLKCFVLITLCCKTKHLRSLVRAIVRGFERLEILGFTFYSTNKKGKETPEQ